MSVSIILEKLNETYPHQPTYQQAVKDLLDSVEQYVTETFTENDWHRLKRLLVPERIISFRVDWVDDTGAMQHNLGYRVQFNSALGPYKGGLRFDPTVNEDVLKFLGFEQIFKNALTGLQLGAGKGGSNFNPKGKSDNEIRSFCQAFMIGLREHVGLEKDVPAGDIGVGGREIGYLFGMYKRITNTNEGVFTGKDELFGGSCQRTEATGHGVVYFAEAMARAHNIKLAGMNAVVSGAGNVAEHTARKLLQIGTTVLTLSDRAGYLHKADGLTDKDITAVMEARAAGKTLAEVSVTGAEYQEGKVWVVKADAYFPCATQNELDIEGAHKIVQHGRLLVEGANMPLTAEAQKIIRKSEMLYGPGKAANAGGVSVSGIEMAQNAGHYAWTCEQVEAELKRIMQHIHDTCQTHGTDAEGNVDYVRGANVAGLKRVLSATKKLGW